MKNAHFFLSYSIKSDPLGKGWDLWTLFLFFIFIIFLHHFHHLLKTLYLFNVVSDFHILSPLILLATLEGKYISYRIN